MQRAEDQSPLSLVRLGLDVVDAVLERFELGITSGCFSESNCWAAFDRDPISTLGTLRDLGPPSGVSRAVVIGGGFVLVSCSGGDSVVVDLGWLRFGLGFGLESRLGLRLGLGFGFGFRFELSLWLGFEFGLEFGGGAIARRR